MEQEYYFDNGATTRTDPQVAAVITDMLVNCYGNPSSLHRKGLEAQLRMDTARRQLAALMGCEAKNLTFTSGATEANNLAIFGAVYARRHGGKKIITTAFEHSSVLAPIQQLEREGYQVVRISPDRQGNISAQSVIDAVDEDTVLVSCMMVNNELGSILPIEQIARGTRRKNPNTFLHCDAVQALGKLPFKAAKLGVDAMAVSGHKIHGPKGIGALYLREGARILPRTFGGEQEKRLRPGTENAAYIVGFGEASRLMQQNGKLYMQQITQCNQRLRQLLDGKESIVFHAPENALPTILNFSVLGIRSEIMLHFLEQKGICVSSGSACAKGAKSHVLSALGLTGQEIDSALRVGFSHENTLEQVEILANAILEGQKVIKR